MADHLRRLAKRGAVDHRSGHLRLFVHQGQGFRNVIHWRVTRYDEPKLIEMSGAGRGGVRINLVVEVQDDPPGSRFRVRAELTGGLLGTRIGRLVARVLRSEIHKSVTNLAALR
jgi:hypothetical protein